VLLGIDLSECSMEDRQLSLLCERLRTLKELRHLNLRDTGITDDGMRALVQLHWLREIGLDRSQLSESCLHELKKIHSLRKVFLYGTDLDEKDIDSISTLTQIRAVYLEKGKITGAAKTHASIVVPNVTFIEI